jgi:hypothetical protein
MSKLSLWKPQKANDYQFFDRTIREMFTVGATDMYVHKYIGITNQGPSKDFTQPQYDAPDPTQIQDLLFLENRDRKYDSSIYRLRGHYNVQNLDFDLSQFGLFLSNDTIFITVHYNDMIDLIGRKLMVGDVLELPHLTDYHPLNEKIPTSLRRYYQVTDGNFASEGFSQTWYPHLWRIKCEPLVNSQEFADILNQPINKDNYLGDWDPAKTYYIPAGQTYTITYAGKTWQITGAQPNGTTIPVGQYPGNLQGPFDPLVVYPQGQTVMYNGKYYVNYGPNAINPGAPLPGQPGSPWTASPWTTSNELNIVDILSTYNKNLAINDANLAEARRILPKSGYDNSPLYIVPTYSNNEPAPPIDIVTAPQDSPPVPARATITSIPNNNYRTASTAIRISAGALDSINNMLLTAGSDMTIDQFIAMSLRAATVAPEVTDTGSGPVAGDVVLTARAMGTITGPYGTADNTYATADQFPSFTVTSIGTAVTSTVIALDNTSNLADLYPQLLLSALVITTGGVIVSPFAPNTRIVSVDKTLRTITINNALVADIPGGTAITVASDFKGNPVQQNIMDYRADADPRFQYIKRSSPRSFGYAAGYLSGTAQAPNGEPTGNGITFPAAPQVGDYFLRTDYLPQKLFRWDGALWIEISQNVRTATGFGINDQSQLSNFINNQKQVVATQGGLIPSRQSLSQALTIRPD